MSLLNSVDNVHVLSIEVKMFSVSSSSCFPGRCVPFLSNNFKIMPVFCLLSACFQAKAKLRALQLLEERGINLAQRKIMAEIEEVK